MDKLTHIDDKGKAKMVEVSKKKESFRRAKATCLIELGKQTLDLINKAEIAKGDVLAVARVAGLMAGKKTSDLIPLCHPLNISSINIEFIADDSGRLKVISEVKLKGHTGVEMEALTSCAVAALTVYDMVKSKDKGVKITDLRLLEKEGGKSGKWQSEES